MAEKKTFATRIDINVHKELKHLSVDAERSISDLLEEAIRDLLKKYNRKVKK